MVINSGNEGGAGASKITRDVTDIVSQVPATLEALTGVDLMKLLQDLPALKKNEPESEDIPVVDEDKKEAPPAEPES